MSHADWQVIESLQNEIIQLRKDRDSCMDFILKVREILDHEASLNKKGSSGYGQVQRIIKRIELETK